jgi:hypothetical protein
MRPQGDKTDSAGMPDGGVDHPVLTACPNVRSQLITLGISGCGIRIETIRARIHIPQINEFPGEGREDRRIVDRGVEAAGPLQMPSHMKSNLCNAGFNCKRGIPCASAGPVESVQFARQPI